MSDQPTSPTPLTSKQRAVLRAAANRLPVATHIGHGGVTDNVRQTVDDVLRTRELVKVQFPKESDVPVKEAANQLAGELGAGVVQVIGRTATLYRENPEIARS